MNTRKGILGLLLMAMLPLTAQTTERGLKECIRMGIERNLGLKNARIGMKHLPVRYMTTYIFIFLFFRNALAPVAGMSLYSNWLLERQQHYIQRLAQNVDNENLQAATYDYGMRRMGQARGGSTLEAQQLSATALRGKITVQATLVAMRDITGTTIWLLVGTIAFVLFFPYHRDEYA